MDDLNTFLQSPEVTVTVDWNVDYVKVGIFMLVLFTIALAVKKL